MNIPHLIECQNALFQDTTNPVRQEDIISSHHLLQQTVMIMAYGHTKVYNASEKVTPLNVSAISNIPDPMIAISGIAEQGLKPAAKGKTQHVRLVHRPNSVSEISRLMIAYALYFG